MSKEKSKKGNARKELGKNVVDTAFKVGQIAVASQFGAGAGAIYQIASNFGKTFVNYWIDQVVDSESLASTEIKVTPFIVIGLGRCGSHITAELVKISAKVKKPKIVVKLKEKIRQHDDSFIAKIMSYVVSRDEPRKIFNLIPSMLIGDIDSTTYSDIENIIKDEKFISHNGPHIFKIDYSPIAVGGAGNVPVSAQFLTRALLSKGPLEAATSTGNGSSKVTGGQQATPGQGTSEIKWESGRRFLANVANEGTRLIFYVFSTGGGTGSGSAQEVLRSQRCALHGTGRPSNHLYFSAFSLLPFDQTNHTEQMNTGRCISQYLASLNIELPDTEAYQRALSLKYEATISGGSDQSTPAPMMPWDGMCLISNGVMRGGNKHRQEMNKAYENANRFVAQQMFNLASSQVAADEYKLEEGESAEQQNYEAMRLDPQDLKTGLIGPYAVCFGTATKEEISSVHGADLVFLRAISLPKHNLINQKQSDIGETVQGISISPERDEADYKAKIDRLYSAMQASKDKLANYDAGMFDPLTKLQIFARCPRAIWVLSAPQGGALPHELEHRLMELIDRLLPNNNQARRAVVIGTSQYYTLSIYLEGSVVLCPEIVSSFISYFHLCWPKVRLQPRADVAKKFHELITKMPPITDEEIDEWLGEREDYSLQVPNYRATIEAMQGSWERFVKEARQEEQQTLLGNHKIDSVCLNSKEVAAALRYVNYIYHVLTPEKCLHTDNVD